MSGRPRIRGVLIVATCVALLPVRAGAAQATTQIYDVSGFVNPASCSATDPCDTFGGTGSGDLSCGSCSKSSGTFRFVYRLSGPDADCSNEQDNTGNGKGTLDIAWSDISTSHLDLRHLRFELPPSPIRGSGRVASGVFAGSKVALRLFPVDPICPSGSSFTGTLTIG
jgi:hypothetical protein